MDFCNCSTLRETIGGGSPLSSAKTALNSNEEERSTNSKPRGCKKIEIKKKTAKAFHRKQTKLNADNESRALRP